MPSGHTTIATTVFLGLAFLIARSVRPKFRLPIYIAGIFIAFIVGVSRLYLGAHWFTDVFSSWLLGSAVLLFVIISFERQFEARLNLLGIALVSLISLMVTYGAYHYYNFEQLKLNYSRINYPSEKIAMNEWWQRNAVLPAYNVSLFGFPSQAINVVWVGDIDEIEKTLFKEGWTGPPARDLVSTLHRIADVRSTQYLSMVSPQYLDKRPELIMARRGAKGVKGLLVLRLWDSNRIINETNETIWVGIIAVVPRSYSWLYKSRPGELDIDPAYIFPNKTGLGTWEWKMMIMSQPTGTAHNISQKIMLIRENKTVHKKK